MITDRAKPLQVAHDRVNDWQMPIDGDGVALRHAQSEYDCFSSDGGDEPWRS